MTKKTKSSHLKSFNKIHVELFIAKTINWISKYLLSHLIIGALVKTCTLLVLLKEKKHAWLIIYQNSYGRLIDRLIVLAPVKIQPHYLSSCSATLFFPPLLTSPAVKPVSLHFAEQPGTKADTLEWWSKIITYLIQRWKQSSGNLI